MVNPKFIPILKFPYEFQAIDEYTSTMFCAFSLSKEQQSTITIYFCFIERSEKTIGIEEFFNQ